jgi:hypothetical protein
MDPQQQGQLFRTCCRLLRSHQKAVDRRAVGGRNAEVLDLRPRLRAFETGQSRQCDGHRSGLRRIKSRALRKAGRVIFAVPARQLEGRTAIILYLIALPPSLPRQAGKSTLIQQVTAEPGITVRYCLHRKRGRS